MKNLGDICYPIGRYTTADGTEKTRWGKCGRLLQNEDGNYRVKLDMIPLAMGDNEGWFSVFPPRDDAPRHTPQPVATQATIDEDMPF